MITAIIDAGQHYCQAVSDLWQWDYGQTLRIQGVKLLAAVEIQFSTTERIGETVTRIGVTQEGVTEVPVPDTLLEGGGTTQDYTIYAFVYIENGDSGKTEYRVSMKVRARPKPEAHATPEEGELFRQAIVAVAESADRAESARKSAEKAADKAESAKNAAESASGSAQASADEAKTSKENAETAVKNAEAFKTETETARSEAVRAATESTDAKDSAEKSRAAAEKAKQDAEAAKAAADADKEAAETARSEAETAKNDAVQAKEAAEKAKIGTAADRETAETASKAARISATSAEESAKKAETAKEEIQESADQIQKNATEIDSLKENKIEKPADLPIVGKILRVKSVNEDGTFICEWADSGGSNLDVRIAGESIVQDGVAEIPVASDNVSGVIKNYYNSFSSGLDMRYGTIKLVTASENYIKSRSGYSFPLVPSTLDYAVKSAMSAPIADTAGMVDGVYHYPAWTADEQAAARERIGIDEWELACDVTLEKDSNNVIIQLNGDYSEVYGILKFPVVPSGEHRMMFYDTNNGSWNNAQGAFCQDVRCNERTFIHAGIYDGIAIFDYHGQTQALAPYPSPVSRSMKECKDTRINAFATFALTSPSGTNFKIWGRKI